MRKSNQNTDSQLNMGKFNFLQKYANQDTLHFLWTNYRLAVVAGIGLFAALIFTLIMGRETRPAFNQLALPPSSPYEHNISGTGFVEANTQNISVGAFTTGIISEVYVTEGDVVEEGEPLFLLDDRTAIGEVNLREREVEAAQANLDVAKVANEEAKDLLARGSGLKAGYSISTEGLLRREFAVQKTTAQIVLYESQLQQAKAQLDLANISLEKLMIRAPVEGLIMKVAVRPGEFTAQHPNSPPPILMGNHRPLYLRVQIDENDAWRLSHEAKAHAYLKSNQRISFPLKFVRVEPYAAPKKMLGGDSTELIDTRILDCLYEIEGDTSSIFIGQQLDVFIEASEGP
jgi:HlyD family secretion protein